MMSEIYFIKRHGGWFRPNAAGYTDDLTKAGQYTKKEAEGFLHADGLTIHPASELVSRIAAERESLTKRLALLNRLLDDIAAAKQGAA